jgi:hypothetical protein
MLRKIHEINFFHIKFLDRTNIKFPRLELPAAQDFYFNGKVLPSINSTNQRLSIKRPTKRGKENTRSDGHCQSEKEMEDHLLACQ